MDVELHAKEGAGLLALPLPFAERVGKYAS